MEYYARDGRFGMWVTLQDRDRVMQLLTRDAMIDLFRQRHLRFQEGEHHKRPEAFGEPPQCTKRRAFYVTVSQDAALNLMRMQPPQFLDSNATCLDFAPGSGCKGGSVTSGATRAKRNGAWLACRS